MSYPPDFLEGSRQVRQTPFRDVIMNDPAKTQGQRVAQIYKFVEVQEGGLGFRAPLPHQVMKGTNVISQKGHRWSSFSL